MTEQQAYIVFLDEADETGRMRIYRMSPEFQNYADAQDYLTYIRTGWPEAYLWSMCCDSRSLPGSIRDQVSQRKH